MVVAGKDFHIRFSGNGKKVLAKQIAPSRRQISRKELLEMSKRYFSFQTENVIETDSYELSPANTLKSFLLVKQTPLSCAFENTSLENQYEICLEKYDLAKQTGISYPQFKHLFHRYGKGIEEITEEAYTLLNQTREAKKIWYLAEKKIPAKRGMVSITTILNPADDRRFQII